MSVAPIRLLLQLVLSTLIVRDMKVLFSMHADHIYATSSQHLSILGVKEGGSFVFDSDLHFHDKSVE